MRKRIGVNSEKTKIYLEAWAQVSVCLGVFLCLCLINSSYSFYKETKENKDAIYLAGVILNYTITSEDLENNRLTLEGNSKTEITI